MTHTLWLARHGLSVANRDNIRQGQMDFELAPQGRRQSEALAARLGQEKVNFMALIASPLRRAAATAEILGQELGLPVEYDDRWRERGAGVAEGQDLAAIRSENTYQETRHAHMPVFEGGESKLDLHLRAASALQALLRRPEGEYLIIAHGGIMSAAIRVALGLAPTGRATEPGFAFANTALAVLIYEPRRGHWVLERLNDRAHLDRS